MPNDMNSPPLQPRRLENITRLHGSPAFSRSVLTNHFHRAAAALEATTKFPKLQAFLPQNLWPWVWGYLKYAFTPRYPFPGYTGTANAGVYRLTPEQGRADIRIAIAGDWGTGTNEAAAITGFMAPGTPDDPDLTIHLGDVYYVGDEPELAENCFGKPTERYSGVTWRHGTQGSFALNGNHEMYANGKPYFTTFLNSLGMPDGSGQQASFFCLETDDWRILAIDTGYNSVGIPILSMIPGINSIQAIGGDCHLEQTLIDWLRNTVQPKVNPKATLLLSHHNYFSAFPETSYTKPAKQLMEFFSGQDVVWLWGHEHRLAIYDKYAADGGITAYGRCIGHGGMPVELKQPQTTGTRVPLLLYDRDRSQVLKDDSGEETKVGLNGFVNLTISGDALSLDYRDIANTSLLVEKFTARGGGAIERLVVADSGLLKPPKAV